MVPALQSDRGKGLEKWCNYCFLNRGLERPAWSEDLEVNLLCILDWSLPSLHPSIPHTLKPRGTTLPFPSEASVIRLNGMLRCTSLKAGAAYDELWLICIRSIFQCFRHIPFKCSDDAFVSPIIAFFIHVMFYVGQLLHVIQHLYMTVHVIYAFWAIGKRRIQKELKTTLNITTVIFTGFGIRSILFE